MRAWQRVGEPARAASTSPVASTAGRCQQQPGQRVPGTRGEDRIGALAEQAPAGRRPLPVPGHRIGQHRLPLVRGRRLAVLLARQGELASLDC